MRDRNATEFRLLLFLTTALVICASACVLPRAAPARSASRNEGGAAERHPDTREVERPPEEVGRPAPALTPSTPESSRGWVNVRVNQDASGYDQMETAIAVNPENPQNLIAASMDRRDGGVFHTYTYTSFDGGQTWTEQRMEAPAYPKQCDPSVAFCPGGKAVFLGLSFTDLSGGFVPFTHTTSDGGATWSGPHTLGSGGGVDKPWVACDTTSGRYRGRVYACWTAFGGSCAGQIYLAYSRDSGESWSTPKLVTSPDGDGYLCNVAVSADGTVNVTYKDDDANKFFIARSDDGGRTFSAPMAVVDIVQIPNEQGQYRRPTLPVLDADRSAGPYSGNLYIVWNDNRYAGVSSILLIRSTDGGITWSAPVVVTDGILHTGVDRWMPWLVVDPKGRVIVTFLDQRRYPYLPSYEIWGAISRDGGRTFDTNFLVSDASSDPTGETFLGDYTAVAATADRLHPLWPDLRAGSGDMDVYTDRYPNIFDYDEVRTIRWPDRQSIDFDPQDERFGQDLDYDLASGLLSELHADGGFERATCAVSRWPAPPIVDGREPPADDGYYYLVRAHGPNGVGTYGYGPIARPNVRDSLNESLDPCP